MRGHLVYLLPTKAAMTMNMRNTTKEMKMEKGEVFMVAVAEVGDPLPPAHSHHRVDLFRSEEVVVLVGLG